MAYAIWNLGDGVHVQIEPFYPDEGEVTELTARQLHRLALHVQLELDIVQDNESRPKPEPQPVRKERDPVRKERDPVFEELENQLNIPFEVTSNTDFLAKFGSPDDRLEKSRLATCSAEREMGNAVRKCDLPIGHEGPHQVTLAELGGGTSQWADATNPLSSAIGEATVQLKSTGDLDPSVSLFTPIEPVIRAPDPEARKRQRESEQEMRDYLLKRGWTEHRDIYDQNIAECWERGGKWVGIKEAFRLQQSNAAKLVLMGRGWKTNGTETEWWNALIPESEAISFGEACGRESLSLPASENPTRDFEIQKSRPG